MKIEWKIRLISARWAAAEYNNLLYAFRADKMPHRSHNDLWGIPDISFHKLVDSLTKIVDGPLVSGGYRVNHAVAHVIL